MPPYSCRRNCGKNHSAENAGRASLSQLLRHHGIMHIVSSSSLCAAVFDVCARCCCFGVASVDLPCLVLKALPAQLSSEPSSTNHCKKAVQGETKKTEENSERKGVIERPAKNGRCLFSMARQNWRTAETRHSHNADTQEPVTACAAPSPPAASLLTAPLTASSTSSSGVSAARFFLGAGVFRTQVQGGTRRCAFAILVPELLDVPARVAERGIEHSRGSCLRLPRRRRTLL